MEEKRERCGLGNWRGNELIKSRVSLTVARSFLPVDPDMRRPTPDYTGTMRRWAGYSRFILETTSNLSYRNERRCIKRSKQFEYH